jgi:hypothetical protein
MVAEQTEDERLAVRHTQAIFLAGVAMQLAMQRDWDAAGDVVGAISDIDDDGVGLAMVAWCDGVIMVHPGGDDDDELIWVEGTYGDDGKVTYDEDANRQSADDVPPEIAWAGQLCAARRRWDKDMFDALMSAVPEDPTRHVTALLNVTSSTLSAVLDRDDDG